MLGGGRAQITRPLQPRVPAPQPGPKTPRAPEPPPGVTAQPRPGVRPAGAFRDVPVDAFADTWELKPHQPLRIGLRLIADADYDKARASAENIARANHPAGHSPEVRWEAYNEALMQWVVARGTCKPDDVSQPFWQCPQDIVPLALGPDGLRLLFDAIEELKIEKTPLGREADEPAIETLGALCQIAGVRAVVVRDGSKRLRRLIRHVLDEMNLLVGPDARPDAALEDEAVEGSDVLPVGPLG